MRDGWVEKKLGDICRVTSGFAFSTKSWREQGLPVIKINNVRNGQVSIDNCSFITEPVPEGASKFLLKKGDLLITLTGEIGAIGFVTQSQPMYLNQRVGRIDLLESQKYSLKFIGLFLTLPEVRAEMWSHGKGNAQLNISPTSIHQLNIQLPPLAEQKRIVDLISSVDSYIEALQQQVDKARKSRNAVLHELLTNGGDDWAVTKLGLISDFVMGQAPLGERCNKEGIGTPFVKAGEFQENRPKIVEWTTDPLKFAKSTDVLVCVVGATAGKINLGADCAIGRSVAAVRPREVLNQFYLYYLLSLELSNLRSGSRGSAQGVITKDDLYRIAVSLPPLAEQKRIVEIISVFDNQIEALDSTITKTHNLRSALLSDLLSGNHEIPTTYDKLIGAA
jgi:restriction endonuclease S subunit